MTDLFAVGMDDYSRKGSYDFLRAVQYHTYAIHPERVS
jgi:hypothetical protein